jgi:thioredoxin-dependent peroxiredoxin
VIGRLGIALGILLSLWHVAPAAADMLQAGSHFPAWKLTDQNGAEVSSQSLRGKTYLLWFFPKAMTPGCTAEGRGLRDSFAEFQKRGVEILGVSFDTAAANKEFVAAEGFPFRLLSDANHELAVAVGAAESAQQPRASRISYLVGPDGVVLHAYPGVQPAAHAKQVLGDLKPD